MLISSQLTPHETRIYELGGRSFETITIEEGDFLLTNHDLAINYYALSLLFLRGIRAPQPYNT